MRDKNNIDLDAVNNMPRHIRVEIAEKIEARVKVGDYDFSKNEEYQKVCEEVGSEYGLTRNEAACLYLGWDAYKKTKEIKG